MSGRKGEGERVGGERRERKKRNQNKLLMLARREGPCVRHNSLSGACRATAPTRGKTITTRTKKCELTIIAVALVRLNAGTASGRSGGHRSRRRRSGNRRGGHGSRARHRGGGGGRRRGAGARGRGGSRGGGRSGSRGRGGARRGRGGGRQALPQSLFHRPGYFNDISCFDSSTMPRNRPRLTRPAFCTSRTSEGQFDGERSPGSQGIRRTPATTDRSPHNRQAPTNHRSPERGGTTTRGRRCVTLGATTPTTTGRV